VFKTPTWQSLSDFSSLRTRISNNTTLETNIHNSRTKRATDVALYFETANIMRSILFSQFHYMPPRQYKKPSLLCGYFYHRSVLFHRFLFQLLSPQNISSSHSFTCSKLHFDSFYLFILWLWEIFISKVFLSTYLDSAVTMPIYPTPTSNYREFGEGTINNPRVSQISYRNRIIYLTPVISFLPDRNPRVNIISCTDHLVNESSKADSR